MKLKKVLLLTTSFLLSATNVQASEIYIHERTVVEAPTTEVPAVCAAFSSDTGWVGVWFGRLKTELWVKKSILTAVPTSSTDGEIRTQFQPAMKMFGEELTKAPVL